MGPRQRCSKVRWTVWMLVFTVLLLFGHTDAMVTPPLGGVAHFDGGMQNVSVANGAQGQQVEAHAAETHQQDDTDGSDCEEWCIVGNGTARHQRGGRRHQRWQPTTHPAPPSLNFGREAVMAEILRNEHFTGDYIGDGGMADRIQDDLVRIATVNINKNLKQKLEDEVLEWTVAHCIDVLVVSDPGWEGGTVQTAWVWDNASRRRVPGSIIIGTTRIGMVLQRDRWQDRLDKKNISYSNSKRSMSIQLRLDQHRTLRVIGTYIHHVPEQYEEEVQNEFRWVERQIQRGREQGDIVLVAGDFNTYPNPGLDRQGVGERSTAATAMSRRFADWTAAQGIESTFRMRHPAQQRFTYERAGTKSALDDIYLSREYGSMLTESGIWLRSIQSSDHAGTPFAVMQFRSGGGVRSELKGVKSIRSLNTKGLSAEELKQFTVKMCEYLLDGSASLIEDTVTEQSSEQEQLEWLERAIDNLYKCLYNGAKRLWGEQNQSRRQIARAVCLKKSRRCTAQLKRISELFCQQDVVAEDVHAAVTATKWPRWVFKTETMTQSCPYKQDTEDLRAQLAQTPSHGEMLALRVWFRHVHHLWKNIMRTRRNWRQTKRRQRQVDQRHQWFRGSEFKQFLRSTLGNRSPPVVIRSTLVQEGDGRARYSEAKQDVQRELAHLLDEWVPTEEKTSRPQHLDTWATADENDLPQFVKDWVLPDLHRDHVRDAFLVNGRSSWDSYVYDVAMQEEMDRHLHKRVAPGYGGVGQELWIAAPAEIRARERRIINMILRLGKAPPILRWKQMIFLPKQANVDPTLNNSGGLPPWRPITVQSALASRLFLVIKRYVERGIPNHIMQHGFQKERTVQDASLVPLLLTERAKQRGEPLFMLSKDCLKCYDRIPAWVMEYIYIRLGVPLTPRTLMLNLLGPGDIEVRTAFGWLSTGAREFGIGQGSILSIIHIGYYMDLLMEQMEKGDHPIEIQHSQQGGGCQFYSTLFVDDQLDVATSYQGLQTRVAVSNEFTGRTGTGGVFGAEKSFMMYTSANRGEHYPAVSLNDGRGNPQLVKVVSPQEGFKHLGIQQGGQNQWAHTIADTWEQLKSDATRVIALMLSPEEFRYIVNSIWIPRLRYRVVLSGAIKLFQRFDVFIRQVARSVLRLPHSTPEWVFYDKYNGVGLESCEMDANIHRFQVALRILNTPTLPVYHLLMESAETYQLQAGLADNPLEMAVSPPKHVRTWIAQIIRYIAGGRTPIQMSVTWNNPPAVQSNRPNDRSLVAETAEALRADVVAFNWSSTVKLRYVGDLCNVMGTRLLELRELEAQHRWTTIQRRRLSKLYDYWKQVLARDESLELVEPVGCTRVDPGMQPYQVRIGVGAWLVASQFTIRGEELVLKGPEVGVRMNSETQQDEFGLQIEVQWYYERPRGSDIWYKRLTRGTTWEYEAVCVPIIPTVLPQRGGRHERIIVWEDTVVEGISGINDRTLLQEAFQRSKLRHAAILSGQVLPRLNTSCIGCGRYRWVTWCERCTRWHHPTCLEAPCTAEHRSDEQGLESQKEACRLQRTPSIEAQPEALQAGDGSVVHANTSRAMGSWALQLKDGTRVAGQLRIHRDDISSTRCEIHALLAGLVLGHDVGCQICDNQSAIQVFSKARDFVRQGYVSIRYGDPHRMEIRSLMEYMEPDGTLQAHWVRSHQEHQRTDDGELRRRRHALEQVDAAAKRSHQVHMQETYATWVKFDKWCLCDDEKRIVMGNTLQFLLQKATIDREHIWREKQALMPAMRRTLRDEEREMLRPFRWDTVLCRFYWRARSGILHTNLIKYLYDARWDPACRTCSSNVLDSQSHRYGLSQPPCENTVELERRLEDVYWGIQCELLLPDQVAFPPGIGHYIGEHWALPQRPLWKGTGEYRTVWQPMIQVSGDIWCHAQWLEWIGDPRTVNNRDGLIVAIRRERNLLKVASAGRLLPVDFIETVRQLLDDRAGCYAMELLQWMPGWAHVQLAGAVPVQQFSGLQGVCADNDLRGWWIDDIFTPHSQGWWEEAEAFCLQEQERSNAVIWCGVYEGYPGETTADAVGVEWILRIPAGALHMRTDQSICQSTLALRSAVYSSNPYAIKFGFIAGDDRPNGEYMQKTLTTWFNLLRTLHYPLSWLLNGWGATAASRALGHPVLSLILPTANRANTACSVWWYIRKKLESLYPYVYKAPSGWLRFPTASESTALWFKTLSYTNKGYCLLEQAFFTRHWEALHSYWVHTCQINNAEIATAGHAELLQRINQGIQHRREVHGRDPGAQVSRLIAVRESNLQEQGRRWHRKRQEYGI